MSENAETSGTGTGMGAAVRSSVRWNAVSLLGRQGLRAITSLVIAGIVGQENYGIIGLATLYVGFVILFVQFGFGTALVQRRELHPGHIGAATWLSIAAGVGFAAVTLVAAPAVADFFATDELTAVLRVLSILVIIKALGTVPSSLLMRDMRFGPLARAELLGATLGSAAGLAAAVLTESYWAIVWQMMVTEGVILLGVFVANPRFGWRTTRTEVADLAGFGVKLLGTNVVNYGSRNGDNAIVGRVEGTEALGDYTLSYRVLSLPVQIIGQSVARTVLPTFSRLHHDRRAIADLYYRSQRAVTALVAGPLVMIALAAPDIIRFVLNEDWVTAADAMRFIALSAIIQLGFGNTGMTLVALDRPGWQFWWSSATTVVSLTGYLVGVRWGIEGVAASRLVIGLPAAMIGVAIVGRLIPVTPWQTLRLFAPIAGAAALMSVVFLSIAAATDDLSVLARLLTRGGPAGLLYVGLVFAMRPVRRDLLRLARRERPEAAIT